MKRKIQSRNVGGSLALVIVFTLVITSCQKTNLGPGLSDDYSPLTESKVIPTPDVPEIIAVPGGNKVIWHAYATGEQIYECQQSTTDPDLYLWVFIEPDATLYADAAFTREVGIHYIGPTWQATVGRKNGDFVVGTKLQSVTEDVTAIPWLLLQAVPSTDPDYYDEITYIQRLYTVGGLAPATAATSANVGAKEGVPYTAEYFFYGSN